MNAISESELTDFILNKAVKKLSIVQSGVDTYQIFITLTWKEGEWNLITTRGKPREWVSLDRLARHICKKYKGPLPPISLNLLRTP